jgi:hypothetical protein
MGVNSHTPGCACPRCGTPVGLGRCVGCGSTALATTLKIDIASLGLSAVPLVYGGVGSHTWQSACVPVSVLGYAVCATTPCSAPAVVLGTITCACVIFLTCTATQWQLEIDLPACNANFSGGSNCPAGYDPFRAIDGPCLGTSFTCASWCTGAPSGQVTARSTIAISCVRPTSLSFPTFTVAGGPNYYVTSAHVYE